MYAVRLPSVCGNAGQHVGALGRNFAAKQLSMSLVCVEMLDCMWQPWAEIADHFAARQLSMSLVCVEMLDSMW